MKSVRIRQRALSEDDEAAVVRKPAVATVSRRLLPTSKQTASSNLTFNVEADTNALVSMKPNIVSVINSAASETSGTDYASILRNGGAVQKAGDIQQDVAMAIDDGPEDALLHDMAEKARLQRAQLRTGGRPLALPRAEGLHAVPSAPPAVTVSGRSSQGTEARAAAQARDSGLSPLSLVALSLSQSCESSRQSLSASHSALAALEAEWASATAAQQGLQAKVDTAAAAYDMWQTMSALVRKHASAASAAAPAVSQLYTAGAAILRLQCEAQRAACSTLWGDADAALKVQAVRRQCTEVSALLAPVDCSSLTQAVLSALDHPDKQTALPSLWMEQVTGGTGHAEFTSMPLTEQLIAIDVCARSLLSSLSQSCLSQLGSSWSDVTALLHAMQEWKVGTYRQLYADTFAYVSLEQVLLPYVRLALFDWASEAVCNKAASTPVHALLLVQQLWSFGEQRGQGSVSEDLSAAYSSDEALVARLMSTALPSALTLLVEGTAYQPVDDLLCTLAGGITGKVAEAMQDLVDFGGSAADIASISSLLVSRLQQSLPSKASGHDGLSTARECLSICLALRAATAVVGVLSPEILLQFVQQTAAASLAAAIRQSTSSQQASLMRACYSCPTLQDRETWEGSVRKHLL